MFPSQDYLNAVIADREREIRKARRINEARRVRSEARKSEPRHKWGIRIRRPQQA